MQNALFFLRRFSFCFCALWSKIMFCIAGWRLANIVLCLSDPAISIQILITAIYKMRRQPLRIIVHNFIVGLKCPANSEKLQFLSGDDFQPHPVHSLRWSKLFLQRYILHIEQNQNFTRYPDWTLQCLCTSVQKLKTNKCKIPKVENGLQLTNATFTAAIRVTPAVRLSVRLSVCPSVCLSVCLSVTCHISKTEPDRAIVTMDHYIEVGCN